MCLGLRDCPFAVGDVARIERPGRLEQHHLDFFFGDREMLHAARNNQEFALIQSNIPVAESEQQNIP